MTYILIGPGIRDPVTTDNLFPFRTVEKVASIPPIHPVEESPAVGQASGETAHRRQERVVAAYENKEAGTEARRRAIFASQIMSPGVVTIAEDATLLFAWQQFRKMGYRHFPIVDEKSSLVGILSEHDFLSYSDKGGILPPDTDENSSRIFVRDFMNSPILTATPDTEIHELARVMFDNNVGAMPIMDVNVELVGIVTHKDILKALIKTAPLELWI